ncbi:MAG: IS110 family transposase [Candidatus Edwardsbacteria bacterium]
MSASQGHFGPETAVKLKELAATSFGIPEGKQGFTTCLKTLASLYQHFDDLLKSIETEIILPLLSQVQHPFSEFKGFSTVQTASFVSELGNPHNFDNADAAVAFFGYDPSISQSGKRTGQGKHISKCGTKYGRETMYLTARSCMLHNPVLKSKYNRLKKSRFWKDAQSILAADLIKICYAMYRDNSAFDPNKIY